jgi:GT2 family glycosyltransferase
MSALVNFVTNRAWSKTTDLKITIKPSAAEAEIAELRKKRKEALKALEEQPDVAIVWGHRRERYPERTLFNRVLDLDWIYAPGITDFCGGDALMRREVLAKADGFSEDLIAGEEPELCQRIRAQGHTILHIDQPMTDHDLAMTRWQAYWKRALRAGQDTGGRVSKRLAAQ